MPVQGLNEAPRTDHAGAEVLEGRSAWYFSEMVSADANPVQCGEEEAEGGPYCSLQLPERRL